MPRFRIPRSRVPILVLSLLACLALLAPPAAPAAQQEIYEQLQKGIEELQKGNLEEGLAQIEKVIDAEPRMAQAHFYAGMASAQMQQWQKAFDYFVAATEQAPGYGEAHMQACRIAYNLQDFDASWEQAILAAQAGIDMSDAFAGLEAVAAGPENWQQRLDVPRVVIGSINTDALEQRDAVFPGRQAEQAPAGADQRGAPPADPFAGLATTTATGAFPLPLGTTGTGLAGALQAEIHEVRRRFGLEFLRSEAFGVVSSMELATHVLYIKVDDVGEGVPRPLTGFVKLFDAKTQEEVYSRPLDLTNISSVSDLRNEVARYLGYMEQWLAEQGRDL